MFKRVYSTAALAVLVAGLGVAQTASANHWCHHGKGYHGNAPMAKSYHRGYGMPYGPHGPMHGMKGPTKGYGMAHGKGKAAAMPYGGSAGAEAYRGGQDGYGEAAADGKAATGAAKDILDTAAGAEVFGTLIAALNAAGLTDTLRGEGPFTVFAPNNDAFGKLPEGYVASLLDDQEKLGDILKYHVVAGRVSAADLVEQGTVETVQGDKLALGQLDVAKADIEASNGIIHVINSVLVPGAQP